MNSYRTVAPTTTIITLAEAKTVLGILDNAHDTRLNGLLVDDTDYIENITNQCIVTQTWVQPQSCFGRKIVCERTPVQSLTVQYRDENNDLQTLDSATYTVMKTNFKCEVTAKEGFPNTYARPDAVIITMVCGYSTIPASLKGAAKKLIATEDSDREGAKTSAMFDRFIFANRKP